MAKEEYIERHSLMRKVHTGMNIIEAMQAIVDEPAADVVEVRHGRWKEWWPGDCALIMTGEEMLWMCSECTAKFSGRSAYCPNRGAKMDGGVNDGIL